MKHMIILALIIGTTAHAAQNACEVTSQDVNTPVPKELKDADIIVRTKDGKERKLNANEYKVVKRQQQFKVKTVTQPCEPVTKIVEVEKKVKENKNLIMAGIRYGYVNLDSSVDGNKVTLYSNRGPIFELSYMRRKIVNNLGAGLGIDTTLSPRVFLGYEF